VRLTAAGEAFLAGARRTVAAADAAVAHARRAAASQLGVVHVGYSWSARFETLPALLQAFGARRPDVELVAEEMWNARMAEALLAGTIDVAIALCPEIAHDLRYQPLRRERVRAVVSADHPLAREDAIDLAALADEEFLLFPRDLAPRLYDFLVQLCRSAGFEPRHGTRSLHTQWTVRAWDDDVVGLVPRSVELDLPASLRAVPVRTPPDQIETQLVWRGDVGTPLVAAFVEECRGAFPLAEA